MNLFLYGAPCAELHYTKQMLLARGYQVRTLADVTLGQRERISVRDTKRLRATEMLMCDAVIIEDELPGREQAECLQLCKSMGMPLLKVGDLDAVLLPHRDSSELIDALDITTAPQATPVKASTPSPMMRVLNNLDRHLAPLLTNGNKQHRINRFRSA
jgi:hypothetical protein